MTPPRGGPDLSRRAPAACRSAVRQVRRVVADLCAGKGFEFTSVGDATLKGFDEPVALLEVLAR